MKLPFSIRDIIATPRHVRLPCDPIPPHKPPKSSKAGKGKKARAQSFIKREKRRSEGFQYLRHSPYPERPHSAYVGSLEVVDTLHMERFSLMRRRRPLSAIGFGKK